MVLKKSLPVMKSMLSIVTASLVTLSLLAGNHGDVHEGDLVFVVNPHGNAITSVTTAIDSLPIDHVAILHRVGGDDGPLYALEAIGAGVCLTPIDSFINANGGAANLVAGRVEAVNHHRSVRNALAYAGRPYDYNYMPDDSAIYCSELVQKTYVDTCGRHIFGTIPMTFRDSSGEIHPYWTQHYGKQGLSVPEGEPGTNPGQLSRDKKVKILDLKF